jgi:oligopeptide transport system permease protein
MENDNYIRGTSHQANSFGKLIWKKFTGSPSALISAFFIIFAIIFSFIGPMISPYAYDQTIKGSENLAPSLDHWLGTDSLGRDILVRLMIGTRISLAVGLMASFATLVIGTVYGSISGLASARVDNIMMRIVDIIYSMPDVLIIILLSVTLKRPLEKFFSRFLFSGSSAGAAVPVVAMFVVFALLYWVSMARIVRSRVISMRSEDYILAAKIMGASKVRIIFRHLLPNLSGPILVTATLQIPSAIYAETFLSFIGLGISAPRASLGSMVSDSLNGVYTYPLRLVYPALVIALLILSFNRLGDSLRDAFDPRIYNKSITDYIRD